MQVLLIKDAAAMAKRIDEMRRDDGFKVCGIGRVAGSGRQISVET